MLRAQPTSELGALELETIEGMTKDGLRDKLFVLGDKEDVERAKKEGWDAKLLSFQSPKGADTPSITYGAVLDTTAGFMRCSDACLHFYELAKGLGVNFVFGPEAGAFGSLVVDEKGAAIALKTKDGKEHKADTTVIAGEFIRGSSRSISAVLTNAAGSFSTQCLPELSYHVESSAGSVARFKIDPSDKELWDKYSPEKFPVITWKSVSRSATGKDQGSVYVFPRTKDGIVKIGYRGFKVRSRSPGTKLTKVHQLHRRAQDHRIRPARSMVRPSDA